MQAFQRILVIICVIADFTAKERSLYCALCGRSTVTARVPTRARARTHTLHVVHVRSPIPLLTPIYTIH